LTLVIFFVLDDENLTQILANILQVKERGATVIVLTNVPDLNKELDVKKKIDHLIQLQPHPSLLTALQCTTPLLMICYYTALAKGLNPDTNIIDSLNYN
jgi:glucosamine 6-phosphate synthetase-like amidotransferase/phosphosugar isomerase protein